MPAKRPEINTAADIKELLLHSKAPTPLTSAQRAELERISKYDVSTYSEEDVRAEIIDPVIRVLGYAKETFFSTEREKHLKVAGGDLFIDYKMTLWSHAFWLIEAKKVKRKALKFTAKELQQALLYAVHPEIDAALVVLCDGRVFEIYDRDESVTEPAARVEVSKLVEQFHVLQALLGPWQAWFFQKRRALRLADRVLKLEMTPGRVEEFADAVVRRVQNARAKVFDNWRAMKPAGQDGVQRRKDLEGASIQDLVATEFFLGQTAPDLSLIATLMVDKAKPYAFDLMYAMFPDHPRNINDNYVALALRTLIAFHDSGKSANWMPAWLGAGAQGEGIESAVKRLIALSLTTFDGVPEFNAVLQFSACCRRLAKIAMALQPEFTKVGHVRHQQARHLLDEFDAAQFISSPQGHNLRHLDELQYLLTDRFVHACSDVSGRTGRFNLARAQTLLKDAWNAERASLGDGADYWRSLKGRNLDGEVHPTEHNWVDYDSLGHIALCVLKDIPKWRDYAVATHRDDLVRIAACGSWSARECLGLSHEAELPRLTDEQYAKRFFAGNADLFTTLRAGYRNRQVPA
jgi:hypothetical protein